MNQNFHSNNSAPPGHPGRFCGAEQDVGGAHVLPLPRVHPLPAVDGLLGAGAAHGEHKGGDTSRPKHPA